MRDREDNAFIDALYRDEYESIRKYIRRMVPDPYAAEDIIQETFLEAVRHCRKLRTEHPNVAGWLRVTAKNKVMKWEDKEKKYCLDMEYLLEKVTYLTDHKFDEYVLSEYYSVLEDVLSKEEMDMLIGYYKLGYSATEMSNHYGITESNFKVRILRMKHRIKNSLLQPFLFGALELILKAILTLGDK